MHKDSYTHLPYLLSSQGVFIFFFLVLINKEVRKNLKNVFTGKKSVPDESSSTRASLLTVSEQTAYVLIIVACNMFFGLIVMCNILLIQ